MQHLANTIQINICADGESKTLVKRKLCPFFLPENKRKSHQWTMDACSLKDVLEYHKKDGAGWGQGSSYIFRTRLQQTYIVLSPVKLQGVSHLGQLTLQTRHLLLLLQQPDRQHKRLLCKSTHIITHNSHKIIRHASCKITHKV